MRKLQIAAGLAVLMLLVPANISAQDNRFDTYRQLKLFGDVFERVRADYVEEVSDQDLIESAIQGMLSALDPHSSYLNADSFRDMRVQTKGEFGGLGIEVTMENGYVKVVSPIDDTPAFRAGIEAGDLSQIWQLSLSISEFYYERTLSFSGHVNKKKHFMKLKAS